jgi:hypothetical protein
MTACKNCGADAPGIACEFCGAIQRQPQDLTEELEALASLSKAAQVVADTAAKNAGGILAQRAMLERQMRNNALAAFCVLLQSEMENGLHGDVVSTSEPEHAPYTTPELHR